MGVRLAKVLSATLMLGQQHALPEEVDKSVVATQVLDRLLETGQMSASQPEYAEELVPEGLRLGLFARLAGPFLGKGDGPTTDFVP